MDTRSLLTALAVLPLLAPGPAPGDESDLAAEIVKLRDEADPDKIAELADFGSRAAMEGLIDLARSGRLASGETVVFLHTGGAPALFGYPELAEWR